jgi:tripartite-type tricarboxylate transporter receptor subunit TctC
MLRIIVMAIACIGAWSCPAAESYPVKPVRLIASFGPGSTADLAARIVSQQLAEQLGKPFVVDNRTGASGTIGYATVARATPDGYTLMLGEVSLTMTPAAIKSLPYDVIRDFTPITQLIRTPMVLVVQPSLNVTTLHDFIALVRDNPDKYNYASVGVGTPVHMATELFKNAAKLRIAQIPYKTGGEMVSGLLGNQTQMLLTTMPNVVGIVKSGKVRALAVTTEGKRSATMPDVPTMEEAGLAAASIYTWAGLFGPAGLPNDLVNRLHAETMKALGMPAVRDRFVSDGAEIVGSTPSDFAFYVRSELQRWSAVVKATGIVAR